MPAQKLSRLYGSFLGEESINSKVKIQKSKFFSSESPFDVALLWVRILTQSKRRRRKERRDFFEKAKRAVAHRWWPGCCFLVMIIVYGDLIFNIQYSTFKMI